jgi:hypothetical protein
MQLPSRRSFLLVGATALAAVAVARPALASWDAHLAKLTSAVKCTAGMWGLDGVQWAGSLKPTPAEIRTITTNFAKPETFFASGPTINGEKFMTTRADGTLLMLKHGTHGVVFVKTAKTFVGCKFDEADTTPAQALVATQNFGDYLKSIGF